VTVGDSDEEHKSPMKNRNSIQQHGYQNHNVSNHNSSSNQNNENHQHQNEQTNMHASNGHHSNFNGGSSSNQHNNSNNSNNSKMNNNNMLRDVKPELVTSYASQKKRLLAKAQSECLIGMKQEPGVNSDNGSLNNHVENGTSKSSKGGCPPKCVFL